MHFTFIALSPTIDVAFLSYQYKFFACKLSADGKAEPRALGKGRKEGRVLPAAPAHKAPQRPACRSSPEEQRSGLAGPGANACSHVVKELCRRSDTACKRQTGVWKRGAKAPRLACNQPRKQCTVCTSSWLAGTLALHSSGSSGVKPRGLSAPCEESWPGELPLHCPWLLQSVFPVRKTCLVLSAPFTGLSDVAPGRACWCHQEQ